MYIYIYYISLSLYVYIYIYAHIWSKHFVCVGVTASKRSES